MICYDAVVVETHHMVLVIYRRDIERIADAHTPVLPTAVYVMVEIVVTRRDLDVERRHMVPVYRTCLIL